MKIPTRLTVTILLLGLTIATILVGWCGKPWNYFGGFLMISVVIYGVVVSWYERKNKSGKHFYK